MPRGMLHRAVTSAGGSAHLSVALPLSPGLTWADVVAGGLDADDVGGKGTTEFWTSGMPGNARQKTGVLPGQCAGGTQCKSALVGKLLFALRHNTDTNGPFALVAESVLLAEPLPMWIVRKYRNTIQAWLAKGKTEAGASYTRALLEEVVALTPLYQQYKQSIVDNAVVAQLFAMNPSPGELLGDAADPTELQSLIERLGTPAHFIKGLLHVKQVNGYTVDQSECPKAQGKESRK